MLSSFLKKPKIYNPSLHEYMLKTNKEYIRKLNERYENNKYKKVSFMIPLDKYDDQKLSIEKLNISEKNNDQIIHLVCFFSVSTLIFYVYNLRK